MILKETNKDQRKNVLAVQKIEQIYERIVRANEFQALLSDLEFQSK
jgi:hypothetical protein